MGRLGLSQSTAGRLCYAGPHRRTDSHTVVPPCFDLEGLTTLSHCEPRYVAPEGCHSPRLPLRRTRLLNGSGGCHSRSSCPCFAIRRRGAVLSRGRAPRSCLY